jgi:hypothetical protein
MARIMSCHLVWISGKFLVGEQLQSVSETANERKRNTLFAILDCDAIPAATNRPQISHYHKGEMVSSDFVEYQMATAQRCFA